MPSVEHIPVFNQQSLNTQFNYQDQKMSAFNMDLNSSNLNLLERVEPPVLHLLLNNTEQYTFETDIVIEEQQLQSADIPETSFSKEANSFERYPPA